MNLTMTIGGASYCVALFVATAGDNDESFGSDEKSLISLSYAVLDCRSHQVVFRQRHLLQPVEGFDSTVTPGCMTLTKLGPRDLDEGITLTAAIDEMEQTLSRFGLSSDQRSNFHLISDGQAHLRLIVHPQAVSINMELPKLFYSFYDLRKEFRKVFPIEHVKGLDHMLTELNIGSTEFDEETFGIRECMKMASIMTALFKRGHRLSNNAETIKPRLEAGLCHKNDYIDDETVVRARGLPWQCSDQDIARFFKGLNIAKGGVALCLSLQGRRNGEALVRFDCREHRDLALKRHKHHLGGRYIEVYRASGRDFISVAGGCNREAQNFVATAGNAIIRMRGLPYTCTQEQIVEFFRRGKDPLSVLNGVHGILFVRHPDGRATGDAFVTFFSEQEGDRALKKHRESIGNRYIELFKSTGAEVQQVLNRCLEEASVGAEKPLSGSGDMASSQFNPTVLPLVTPLAAGQPLPAAFALNHTGGVFHGTKKTCIHIKAMPPHATIPDILNFLGEHSKNISFQGVHLVYTVEGIPSGEAFIQMESELAAESAYITRNNKYMHINGTKHYLEVKQVSGNEVNQIIGFKEPAQATTQAAAAIMPQSGIVSNSPLFVQAAASGASLLPAGSLGIQQPAMQSPVISGYSAPVTSGLYFIPPPVFNTGSPMQPYQQYPSPPSSPGTSGSSALSGGSSVAVCTMPMVTAATAPTLVAGHVMPGYGGSLPLPGAVPTGYVIVGPNGQSLLVASPLSANCCLPTMLPGQLALKNVPHTVALQELIAAFIDCPGFMPNDIQFSPSQDGYGECFDVFLTFSSKLEAQQALAGRQTMSLAGKQLMCFLVA